MKKKILFFAYNLRMGGAEKVLVDFIRVLQPHYDIDLALLRAEGELMDSLPEEIRVVEMRASPFSYSLFRFIPWFRRRKINRIIGTKDYFAAIGFFEGRSATWVADIRKDLRKIAWIHTDLRHFDPGISKEEFFDSYSKMDTIVTVSEQSAQGLMEKYHIDESKIAVLPNIINEEHILRCSREAVEPNDCFTFINVGKMRPEKRQDRLVEVARLLKNEGYSFKIQILGNGPEEETLRAIVNDYDLNDCVELKGLVVNPYPYILQADCAVLSSDFEGFSVFIKEAMFLKKPVITTDVAGWKESFENGKYGVVSERDTDALYRAMKAALEGKTDLKQIERNLHEFDSSNSAIEEKLLSIIEG